MGASASKSKGLTNNYRLQAYFNQVEKKTNDNYSRVYVEAKLTSTNINWSSSYASKLRVYWHDNRENYDREIASIDMYGCNQYSDYYATGTIDVYHKDDGTLSGYVIATFTKGGTSAYAPNSDSVATDLTALEKIDRYAMMSNASNNNTNESTIWFDYNNPRNLNMESWLEINPTGQHLAIRTITNPGTSGRYTYELTQEEKTAICSQVPSNTNNATLRIGIYSTLNGTRYASYKDKTFSIVNGNPVFSNFDVADVNPTTVALTGSTTNNIVNVNGYSNIQATVTTNDIAEPKYNATMNKYRFKIGSNDPVDIAYSGDSNVSGTINGATTGIYELFAIDSRQNSTSVVKQAVSIINYNVISFDKQNCSFLRDDNRVGGDATLTIKGTFWNGDFGEVNNSIKSVSYRFKKIDSSTWINGTTRIIDDIQVSGNIFTFSDNIASDNQDTTWDLDANYNLEVTIEDELSSATVDFILNSAIPTMSLDKNGVGVMCAYDSSKGGKLQVDGEPIDIEIYSTNEEKTNKIWVDGKPIYRRVVIFTNVSYSPTPTYNVGLTPSVLDTLIDIQGTYQFSSGSSSSIPRGHPSAQSWECNAYIQSNGLLTLEMGSSYVNLNKAVIVLLYTKK